MKILVSFLIVFYCYASTIFSQCDGAYFLYTQADVDNFGKMVNYCPEISQLFIQAQNSNITNLDSLRFINKITKWFEIKNDTNLRSVVGLSNLKFVQVMQLKMYHSGWQFPSLDTVGSLDVYFINPNLDLSPFDSIKSLGGISAFGNCKLEGMSSFTSNPNNAFFGIGIHGNTTKNTIKNILPNNINDLKVNLTLSSNKNLDLNGLQDIPILLLHIAEIYNGDMDFTAINHVKKLKELRILSYEKNLDELDIFPNVDTIEFLNIRDNNAEIDPFNICKNLESISINMIIESNKNYKNISWLNKLPLPRKKYIYDYIIDIKDNAHLNNCNIDFLCNALKTYPDSTNLFQNGSMCTKDEVMKYCLSSANYEPIKTAITIYPNPALENVYISGINDNFNYKITDITGKIVCTGKTGFSIDTSLLNPGIYTLFITTLDYKFKTFNFIKLP